MRSRILFLSLLLCGCNNLTRVSGHDSEGGLLRIAETLGSNILINPTFSTMNYGTYFDAPNSFTDIADHWVVLLGSDGAVPYYQIQKPYGESGIEFDVFSFDTGTTRRGVLAMQSVAGYTAYRNKNVRITVTVKTDIWQRVQFVVDAGTAHSPYSRWFEGAGSEETITLDWHVPNDASLLWVKVGMTSGFFPKTGYFIIKEVKVQEIIP